MNFNLHLNENQLNRLFPFYIIIDSQLKVKNCGISSTKLFQISKNDYFNNHFFISRPFLNLTNFDELKEYCNQLVVLEHKINGIKFRGQFDFFEDEKTYFFTGSPWFTTMEELLNNNLTINDFAHHDPLIDLLHVLQTQEISNNDLKKLVNTINNQKQALNLKNKEINDIALFPMQNPDPLIRINFAGEMLKNNPAAAQLDFFEFENKSLRIDDFLIEIANRVTLKKEPTFVEAISNNLTYSFACIPMPKEGYINLYGRNISERKKIELKLEEQRKFYEDILNNMPADIAVFNTKHEYLFANPKAIRDQEVREWIIGKTDFDYCTEKQKPLNIAEKRSKSFNHVVENKQTLEWEENTIKSDGEEEIVLRRWFPVVDENNNVKIVIGYGIDITERKKSEEALKINEEKYRSIIANMNLGLMELNNKGNIEFVNQRIQKMTGFSEDELVGKNPQHFIITKQDENQGSTLIKDTFEIETNIKGKKAWWLVSAAPQFTASGKIKGSIIICLDISEQKKLEKELIKSREVAEELAKTKETFLANMSHEIRTPMNAIMGIGNQLAKTDLNEKQQFFIKTINNASENLLYIINDILDLSKIEAGKLSIEKIAFEPKKEIQQTLQMLNYKAEEKGLELKIVSYDEKIFNVLIGDPFRLNQILINLISNSIKFTERGQIEIKAETIKSIDEEQLIRFSVKDYGIGMDESFTKLLFDKFSQEYESGSRKYGGTGLGMSICKELIKLMGGEINVESKKNVGTTVSFVLPFKKGVEVIKQEVKSLPNERNSLKDKKIIVADDNEMNRLVARTILENYEATVIEAANGKEAVLLSQVNNPDLILMDIQMPVLNGYEATKEIREQKIHTPIIALTANVVKGEKEKCRKAGMSDFITKPFNEEDFINCILNNLDFKTLKSTKTESVTTELLYNLTELNKISNGNKAFLEKMITLFSEIGPKTVAEIKEAFENNDIDKVNKLAHRLKPSIDNLSIFSLKDVIRKIEVFKLSTSSNNELKKLINKLESTIDSVINNLQKEII